MLSDLAVLRGVVDSIGQDRAGRANQRTAWWAVAGRFFLHGLIVSTWVSRIPAIKMSLGLSNAQFGFSLLGTAVGSVLAVPLAGWLVARAGSRRVTTWSTLGFSLALFVPSLATNGLLLFGSLILFGAFAGTNDVAINSQGVALEEELGTPSMSRFHAMFSIGGMMGASLGAFLARGIATDEHLVFASIAFLAASIVTAPWLPAGSGTSHKNSDALRFTSFSPVLLTLAGMGFAMFLFEGAIADWSGVYLKQALRVPVGLAAAGYAVFSAGMALFRLLGDTITERFGAVLTVRSAALTASVGLSLALLAPSTQWALAGFALTGAGVSVIVPLVFAASGRASDMVPGAGIAMVSGSGYAGFLFGPPLIGLLAQRTSLRDALLILVALSLATAIFAPAVRMSDESS